MRKKLILSFSLTTWLLVCANVLISCEQANIQPTVHPVIPSSPIASLPNQGLIDIGDGGFLSENPCGPPCFYGIILGQTQKDDAIQFLQEKIGLQNCQIWDTRKNSGDQGAICDPYLVFSFSNIDVVDEINFKPFKKIAIDEVIKKYGEPSRFSVSPYEDDSGNIVSVSMVVSYDEKYISVGFLDQEGSIYNITQSTLVNVISYSDQDKYERYLQKIKTDLWYGYGEYQINGY